MLEGETEPPRGAARGRDKRGIVGLREVDEPGVVAEVDRQQLGMGVQTQPLDDESIEVAGQEIGQEEGPELLVGDGSERLRARVELVAVGARQALDPFVGQHRVEQAARPAVGVGDEDVPVSGPGRADPVPDEPRDPAGSVVERRRQAGQVDIGQARLVDDGDQLARQRAAADDEDAIGVRRVRPARGGRERALSAHRLAQAALARRSSMSRRAVSAATPASRQ